MTRSGALSGFSDLQKYFRYIVMNRSRSNLQPAFHKLVQPCASQWPRDIRVVVEIRRSLDLP